MLEKIKEIIEQAKKFDLKTLEAIRYILFISVAIDLFGVYYWLGIKNLGGALLMVIIAALAIVLILERRLLDKKMDGNESTQEPKAEEKPMMDLGLDSMDIGLPNAEDYQKRMEEQFGTI